MYGVTQTDAILGKTHFYQSDGKAASVCWISMSLGTSVVVRVTQVQN